MEDLAAEAVQSAALSLERIDDVHGCDGLALRMFAVGDGVTDDILEENLQDSAGFLVDETGDSLHSTSAGQTADSWLGDPLDVVSEDFAMALGASLAQAFTTFAASGHL